MAKRYGALLPEGKVRAQTPRVARTSPNANRYSGGSKKFKKRSERMNQAKYTTMLMKLNQVTQPRNTIMVWELNGLFTIKCLRDKFWRRRNHVNH